MSTNTVSNWMHGRAMTVVACAALTLPMVGRGSGASSNGSAANRPPIDDTQGGMRAQSSPMTGQPQRQGMSTGKKVMLVAGAAALYYMYRKNQEKKAAGQLSNGQPQYYLSKNGRVYYREANGQAHYVTAPTQPMQVPYDEAQQYNLQQYQGYNNQTTGYTDLSRFAAQGGM